MEMVRLDPPAELTMPIGEAMFSQRATRRLDTDRPITDAQSKIILDAASKAPNGGNVQPARFLVIRDREAIKKSVSSITKRGGRSAATRTAGKGRKISPKIRNTAGPLCLRTRWKTRLA